MSHRCRDYDGKLMFSIRTGTVMEGSNLEYRTWAVGIYLFTTNIKGVSSMRLHRELCINQKAAWFMLYRLERQEVGWLRTQVGRVQVHHLPPHQALTLPAAIESPVAGIQQERRERLSVHDEVGDDATAPLSPSGIPNGHGGAFENRLGESGCRLSGLLLGLTLGPTAFLGCVHAAQPHGDRGQLGRHIGAGVDLHGIAVHDPHDWPRVVGRAGGHGEERHDNERGSHSAWLGQFLKMQSNALLVFLRWISETQASCCCSDPA